MRPVLSFCFGVVSKKKALFSVKLSFLCLCVLIKVRYVPVIHSDNLSKRYSLRSDVHVCNCVCVRAGIYFMCLINYPRTLESKVNAERMKVKWLFGFAWTLCETTLVHLLAKIIKLASCPMYLGTGLTLWNKWQPGLYISIAIHYNVWHYETSLYGTTVC